MLIHRPRHLSVRPFLLLALLLAGLGLATAPVLAAGQQQIPGAPVLQLRADQEYLTAFECTTLRWDAANVDAVYILQKSVPLHGTGEVCPKQTTTYAVQATWKGRTISQSLTIQVGAPKGFSPGKLPAGALVLRDQEFASDSGYGFEAFGVLLPTRTARVYTLDQIAVKWEGTGDILHAIIYPGAMVSCGGVQKYESSWRAHAYWFDLLGAEGDDYANPGTIVTRDCAITIDAYITYLPITDAVSDLIGGATGPEGRSLLEARTLKDLQRETVGLYMDKVTLQLRMP